MLLNPPLSLYNIVGVSLGGDVLQECGLWYQEVEGRQGAGQGAGFKQTWDADGYLVMHMIHMPYAYIKL